VSGFIVITVPADSRPSIHGENVGSGELLLSGYEIENDL
jgi:hypothetical protein